MIVVSTNDCEIPLCFVVNGEVLEKSFMSKNSEKIKLLFSIQKTSKDRVFLKETESNQKPEAEGLTYRNQQSFVRTGDVMLKKLVDHEQEFTKMYHDTNTFDLGMLQRVINQVEYPSLDLKKLKLKWDKRLINRLN